jgi:transcriptional regulator with XRE-family HTH domain
VNTKSSLANELKDKEYRHAFVASQIRIGLPLQCRALREGRGWTQPQLAQAANMSQPRISEIERPGERKLNIETLLRLAEAFDVALDVRFVTFRDLVDAADKLDLDKFFVNSFNEDLADLENEEIWAKAKHSLSSSAPRLKEMQDDLSEIDAYVLGPQKAERMDNLRKMPSSILCGNTGNQLAGEGEKGLCA